MPDTFQSLTITHQQAVAYITINHGEINLLDATLVIELISAVDQLSQDDDTRVIVFQSANPEYFASHADFQLLQQLREQPAMPGEEIPMYSKFLEKIRTMPKVSIAKVEGRARGGGAELVLAMDMSFAAIGRASLSQMEIIMGIGPGGGGALYLARKVGRQRSMEICLGGGDFPAELAAAYGYINRALPDEEIGDFVDELAQRIATYDPLSIARNKAMVNILESTLEENFAENNRLMNGLVASDNFDRRVENFLAQGGNTASGERDDWKEWAAKLGETVS